MSKQINDHQDPPGESWRGEPIQPKQKAVLEFLKMPVPPTRGGASNLIKAVFEGPGGNAHQNLWNASKHELHPDLYPEPPKKLLPPPKPTSLFTKIMVVLAGVAVVFYAMDQYVVYSNKTPAVPDAAVSPEPAPATEAPAPATVAGVTTPSAPKTVNEMVSLESTDGRTIQARILAFTKESIVIRREDGESFDLPLEKLTAGSRKLVEEQRAARRAGRTK